MSRGLVATDFFCGAGGMTRGFLDAGIPVRLGIDINPAFRETFQHNNPGAKFLAADLARLNPDTLLPFVDGAGHNQQVFIACAPCQPFTKLRTNPRGGDAPRLLMYFCRIVLAMLPDFLVIENVPGIARVQGLSTFRRFLRCLDDAGYSFAMDVLDAKNFGVPQTRRRLLLIASRVGAIELPRPTHGRLREPYSTVRDGIGRFPPIAAGQTHPFVPNHVAAALSSLNLRRISQTPRDGGSRADWPRRLRLLCHSGVDVAFSDVYGRMNWDRPSPTITSRCNSLSNGRFGHPEQNRAISLREAASLQSFPDSYVFYGPSKASIAAQIGNAVPVAFAKAIGEQIRLLARDSQSVPVSRRS